MFVVAVNLGKGLNYGTSLYPNVTFRKTVLLPPESAMKFQRFIHINVLSEDMLFESNFKKHQGKVVF